MICSYLTVWEMTQSVTASSIAGALMLFDVGVLILNRYILLDPILLFFISSATYSMAKFRNFSDNPFSKVHIKFQKFMVIRIQHIVLKPILAELELDNASLYLQNWWLWLAITGVMLGSAFSVKFVGLFVILLVSFEDVS